VGEQIGATTDGEADPFKKRGVERWIRHSLNRLRGRGDLSCMLCGRYLPEIGSNCVCGMTLLARSRLEPISEKEFRARTRKF
jgi:hypothetical protein